MGKLAISARLTKLPVSSVRKLSPIAQATKDKGRRVYHLNIGDPDIKTPKVMLDALKNFPHNPIRYADAKGEAPLLDALVHYFTKVNASFITKEDILVTTGGSEANLFAFFAVAEPGDEILVFEPYYSNYATLAAIVGVTLKAITTTSEEGFHLPDKKTIEKSISKKTKAILICSPGNPTGTVYTKKEMEMLVSIVKEHNLFFISDEVYREFIYEKPHVSLLSYMQEIPDRSILLDSLSKRYSLCGARIGIFVSLNKDLIQLVIRMAQGRLSAGLIDQAIAAKLTDVPNTWITTVKKEYEKRRNVLYKGLSAIPGVSLAKPEGAFYTMVTLPVDDAEKFAIFLLRDFHIDNETVMLAPGYGFYQNQSLGKKQVRIAYVLQEKDLKRSVKIIKEGLIMYNKKK